MLGLLARLFRYITVAAFRIYAQCGENAVKGTLDAMHQIAMKITLLIMESHGKNHGIVFLNFCGNPAQASSKFLEV